MESGSEQQSLISDPIWEKNVEYSSKGKGKELIPNSSSAPSYSHRRGLTFQELLHEVEVGNFTGKIMISPVSPYLNLNSAPESTRLDNSIPSFAPITPGKSSSGSVKNSNSNSNVDGNKEGSRTTLENVGIVTPEPKPRRKRHRPRVITEKKPRAQTTPTTTTEIREKRKYVRKKPIEKPSAEDEAPILEPRSPRNRSCKRVLHFGEMELDGDDQSVSSITVQLCRGIEEKDHANGVDYGFISWQNNKKKRSEKGTNNNKNNAEASSSSSSGRIVIDLTEYWTTTTTKKRSRNATRARDSSSFAPESYVDALIARKKRTKKPKPQQSPMSVMVEEIERRLKCLDINRESESKIVPFLAESKRERNELVLYGGFGGAIVPVKKSLLRAKVELDDETSRVWKLLLENINSEGIDGMDEQKKKWWEEERSVFRGRAESFIARMHLVQGDRRFSKWKGSVLDSVVGVFLTQNVSDHLSSSAFMSLAARYPLKPKHESEEIHISENGIQIVTLNDPEDEGNDKSEIAGPERKESIGSNDAECVDCSTSLLENLRVDDEPTETSSATKSAETLPSLDHKERVKMGDSSPTPKIRRFKRREKDDRDWDQLRREAEACGRKPRPDNTRDSLDWEAIRCASVHEIADTIKERGMNHTLAQRIQDFLNRLVIEHGSTDLEWLRDVPPDQAKEFLLSIKGLGLKSVECVRLLTLHHLAFPVDTNVGRIAVRLGWVPLQPLPESLQLHLLELYPVLETVQKYLWPRLCKLDQKTLYELHYQMITFGKVFCTKSKPNCNSCPMRGECRHFASAFASARLALPGPDEKCTVVTTTTENRKEYANLGGAREAAPLALPEPRVGESKPSCCEPIIEEPASPEPEFAIPDIEDFFPEDLDEDEIPTIKLDLHEFTQNVQSFMLNNLELREGEMSKALVSLGPEAASIPMPKLKNVGRLRTEHQVYELPDSHPLLEMMQMEKREPDDPSPYLLAIWTPGETPDSVTPPEKSCFSQALGKLCDDVECFSCNSTRETNSQTVRGTILIPCRTAMRGSFPLNGTYFQVNEVFADHNSSLNPINVQRGWIWKLQRRTVYFGTSIPTIFKGLTAQGIQQCFWKGYVCVRGFDQKTRAPRPLMARLHFPASKGKRTRDLKSEK